MDFQRIFVCSASKSQRRGECTRLEIYGSDLNVTLETIVTGDDNICTTIFIKKEIDGGVTKNTEDISAKKPKPMIFWDCEGILLTDFKALAPQ